MAEPTPSDALAELIAQHEALRALMDRCEQLAAELDAGDGDMEALAREVGKLRIAFDAHNEFEERLLGPVLRELDSFGDVRIDRMVGDHIDEHRAVHLRLAGSTGEMRDAIVQLRVHLEAEEHHFLTSRVLRDDTVIVESGA
jgi:hypothetical protein